MKVGKAIKAARVRANITQADLAHRLGVKSSTVCGWEKSDHGIRMNRLPAIAKALGVEVSELVA